MCRLICTFVVCMLLKQVFSWCGSNSCILLNLGSPYTHGNIFIDSWSSINFTDNIPHNELPYWKSAINSLRIPSHIIFKSGTMEHKLPISFQVWEWGRGPILIGKNQSLGKFETCKKFFKHKKLQLTVILSKTQYGFVLCNIKKWCRYLCLYYKQI